MLFNPEYLKYLRWSRAAPPDPADPHREGCALEKRGGRSDSLCRAIDTLAGLIRIILWLLESIGSAG